MKYILLLLCACMLSACSPNEPVEATKPLESYEENESPYEYLTEVRLGNEHTQAKVYLPESEDLKVEDMATSSSRAGIHVALTVLETPVSPENDLLSLKDKEITSLKEKAGIGEITASDVVSGEGNWLIQLNYEIREGNNVYPCVTLLKIDQIRDYYLQTVIDVDNTKTTEESQGVLGEVLEVFGIELAKGE